MNSREAIHLVMRSSWAKGPTSFRHPSNKNKIEAVLRAVALKHQVRVYRKAIVGNHIHLVFKVPDRHGYCAFIRSISGQIARHIMRKQSFKNFLKQQQGDGGAQAKNQEVQGKDQQFWQFRPWTRILCWGKDFKTCCGYVVDNVSEALGFIPYKKTRSRYERLLGSRSREGP